MQSKPLDNDLTVSGQLQPDDVAALAAQGVRSIINNRPDGEEDDQPTGARIESEARRLGMAYRSIPVIQGKWTPATVEAFADALRELPHPVHAYCRSGMRSATMWAMQACANGATVDLVLFRARQAGYDLASLYNSLCKARDPA